MLSCLSGGLTNSSEEADGWDEDEDFGGPEDLQEKEAQDRLRRLNMRGTSMSRSGPSNFSRGTLERQGSLEGSESSLASSHSHASNLATGSGPNSVLLESCLDCLL